jgi:hypothetical protein
MLLYTRFALQSRFKSPAPSNGCTRIARGCDSADIALACALAKTAVAPARLRKEEAIASAVQQEIRRQIGTA